MMQKVYALLFILLSSFQFSFSQGTITGNVIDKATGETLPGATIKLEGTSIATVTDFDGNFRLQKITAGNYVLEVNMMGFATKKIKNVLVEDKKVVNVNFILEEPKTVDINEVVIEATARRESMNAILIQQKNRIAVSDGISAETIKKTPDKNAGDVVKRISGTTIQDNKFVIVRGLNDRYNYTMLNGNPLPSTESDRKAFSFDLFPASLLDNITILKTGTPDMPGDFAGGIVTINTRAIPESNSQSISISSGYNDFSTNKKFVTTKSGKYDKVGIDDGSRELPSALPDSIFRSATATDRVEYAKMMPNNWALQTIQKAAPSLNFQYQIGRVGKVLNNDAGLIFALTYGNSFNTQSALRNDFTEQPNAPSLKEFELKDTSYSNQVNTGAVLNLSTKIGTHSQVSFKNLFTINTDNRVIVRNGIRDYSAEVQQLEKSSVRWYTENQLLSNQLQGEHLLSSKKGIKLNWNSSYNNITRNTPAIKRMMYTTNHIVNQEDSTQKDKPFAAAILPSGASPNAGGNIFSSKNNEQMMSGNIDLTLPLSFIKKVKSEFKIGIARQQRNREFKSRHLSYNTYKVNNRKAPVKFADSLLTMSEDSIFAPSNMGVIKPFQEATATATKQNGLSGFTLDDATKLNDSYTASSLLNAAYAMYDVRFLNNWHIVAGTRVEEYNQKVNSFSDDGTPVGIDNTVIDWLPSANLVYSLNEKTNLRAAFYKTVSRPEYRELAPFGFFDFTSFFTVRGNPLLQRATINNYDLRYEWFGTYNQLFSTSVFYKSFANAIEQVSVPSESRTIDYQNIAKTQNYGVEFEFRINAAAISKQYDNKFLANLSTFANVSLIKSVVDLTDVKDAGALTRPLQGQSPYIVNCGLQYFDNDKQQGISISVNKIGRRIYLVGNIAEPSIWENPRTVIDMQISKLFFKHLELKINLRDALANDYIFYQDLNNNGKYDKDGTDNMINNLYNGRTISLGASWRF